MKTLRDIDVTGKTVLLRADYNVPLESGRVGDDYRIRGSIPTLQYLLAHNCRIVIISHLGRPEGSRDERYSLRPVAKRLMELLNQTVALADFPEEVDGEDKITLLENLRFWPEEEANDPDFAKQLADLGDVFVQDGFGVVHRAHASTDAITKLLPSVAGLLLEKEVTTITEAMENPKQPLVVIFGGAKISDKIGLIERFIDKADTILIGGAMANTFLKYQGLEIGKSKYEAGQEKIIKKLLASAVHENCERCRENYARDGIYGLPKFVFPDDAAVGKNIDTSERRAIVSADEVNGDEYILDIGPRTIEQFTDAIKHAATVIWNGPVGMTELPNFAEGSNRIAQTLKQCQGEVESIVGGGDTAGFVLNWGPDKGEGFSHISTGGGAALELMAGKTLPGIVALDS